jgi:hypothetical protein
MGRAVRRRAMRVRKLLRAWRSFELGQSRKADAGVTGACLDEAAGKPAAIAGAAARWQ